MHILKDSLLVIARIYTIYPLLLAVTLFMGRRAIGQLPVFDFLIILSLGSVVGADIADPRVEHIHTAVAVIAIGLLQKGTAHLMLRYRKIDKLISFEPVIVLKDGQLLHKNLKKIFFTVDDILSMLREQQLFDPSVIDMAIIEKNGELSVLRKAGSQPVTPDRLGMASDAPGMSYPLIKDGRLEHAAMDAAGVTEEWLMEQLGNAGLELRDVFFASINDSLKLNISVVQKHHWNIQL